MERVGADFCHGQVFGTDFVNIIHGTVVKLIKNIRTATGNHSANSIMNFNNFTIKTQEAIQKAVEITAAQAPRP